MSAVADAILDLLWREMRYGLAVTDPELVGRYEGESAWVTKHGTCFTRWLYRPDVMRLRDGNGRYLVEVW